MGGCHVSCSQDQDVSLTIHPDSRTWVSRRSITPLSACFQTETRWHQGRPRTPQPWSPILWEAIEPLLPKEPAKPKGGRPRVPDCATLGGVIFVLRTGCPWRLLPKALGCGGGITCWLGGRAHALAAARLSLPRRPLRAPC